MYEEEKDILRVQAKSYGLTIEEYICQILSKYCSYWYVFHFWLIKSKFTLSLKHRKGLDVFMPLSFLLRGFYLCLYPWHKYMDYYFFLIDHLVPVFFNPLKYSFDPFTCLSLGITEHSRKYSKNLPKYDHVSPTITTYLGKDILVNSLKSLSGIK